MCARAQQNIVQPNKNIQPSTPLSHMNSLSAQTLATTQLVDTAYSTPRTTVPSTQNAKTVVDMPSNAVPHARASSVGVSNRKDVTPLEFDKLRRENWHLVREDGGIVLLDDDAIMFEPATHADLKGKASDAFDVPIATRNLALACVKSKCTNRAPAVSDARVKVEEGERTTKCELTLPCLFAWVEDKESIKDSKSTASYKQLINLHPNIYQLICKRMNHVSKKSTRSNPTGIWVALYRDVFLSVWTNKGETEEEKMASFSNMIEAYSDNPEDMPIYYIPVNDDAFLNKNDTQVVFSSDLPRDEVSDIAYSDEEMDLDHLDADKDADKDANKDTNKDTDKDTDKDAGPMLANDEGNGGNDSDSGMFAPTGNATKEKATKRRQVRSETSGAPKRAPKRSKTQVASSDDASNIMGGIVDKIDSSSYKWQVCTKAHQNKIDAPFPLTVGCTYEVSIKLNNECFKTSTE